MELEFYDSEKHGYFLDAFKDFSQEPVEEEKEFFRDLISKLVEQIADVTGISTDFKLYFAMTDELKVGDDLPINFYVHGFSFPEWMEGFDVDVIMIRAVKGRENWRACLVNMLAHEMAHQEFYSVNRNSPITNWQNIVFEGHAMNRAEEVAQQLGVSWKPHYRSENRLELNPEAVISVLDEDRSQEPENIFENGEQPCENAEGYNLAYQVVKEIVERKEISLDEVPERDQEDMRKEVEKSVKTLYS